MIKEIRRTKSINSKLIFRVNNNISKNYWNRQCFRQTYILRLDYRNASFLLNIILYNIPQNQWSLNQVVGMIIYNSFFKVYNGHTDLSLLIIELLHLLNSAKCSKFKVDRTILQIMIKLRTGWTYIIVLYTYFNKLLIKTVLNIITLVGKHLLINLSF